MMVGIITNFQKIYQNHTPYHVCTKLLSLGFSIMVEDEYYQMYNDDRLLSAPFDEMMEKAKLVVVIGGDGTIIHAAKRTAPHHIPVLGINAGRIGFMTDLEFDELDLLDRLNTNSYIIERRMMLEAFIDDGESKYCLNDVVASKGVLAKIVDYSITCDDKATLRYRADGIIFSTPTGSTAYALAAGGPVVEPSIETILCTPICSHSTFSRTIMLHPDSVLRLSCPNGRSDVYVTFDGETALPIGEGRTLTVQKSRLEARFIRIKNDPIYTVLEKKLLEADHYAKT